MTDEIAEAQEAVNAVHAATPQGWYVGRTSEHPKRQGGQSRRRAVGP